MKTTPATAAFPVNGNAPSPRPSPPMGARVSAVLAIAIAIALLATLAPARAADAVTETFQRALFEEEANQNYDAAIRAYTEVVGKLAEQRKLAATALFRLGECYRKLGRTNDAVAQYQRLLAEFTDQTNLLVLCRQNLRGLGAPAAESAAASVRDAVAAPFSVSDEEEKEIRRIRALIQDSPDLINGRDGKGLAPLHNAAASGYARVVRFLLDSGADPNLKAGSLNNGKTALSLAASGGHKAVVDLLLDAKADAAARDTGGNTPLHLAAMHGYRLIVERLLAAGVPVNGRNNVGMTPLHYAVAAGNQSVVELLFKKGADLNLPATFRFDAPSGVSISAGYTPVHTAIAADQIALVRWLNTNGANVNAPAAGEQWTPLHLAAHNNNVDAIRALMRPDLDLDAANAYDQTPLYTAVSAGKFSAAALLLDAGANPNGRPGPDPPMLHAARNSEEMFRLLLTKKANLEITDYRSGATVLMAMVGDERPSTNLISLLLGAGANPNTATPGGYTPLHTAAMYARPEIVALLLRHGANVNAINSEGATPLFYARTASSPRRSAERVEQTVALLLAGGADETLQRRRSISVSRRTRGFEASIFAKGTNDFNRHSLFEFITTVYEPNGWWRSLPFPDLEHLVVNRALGGGRTAETNLDVDARLAASGCAGDFSLEWGDVVEIPELDHPLPASWPGFNQGFARTLKECVSRKVSIVIKGRTNVYEIKPGLTSGRDDAFFSLPSFRLAEVLRSSGLLLTSSDPTRVRVSRRDPITNGPRQWTLDTTKLSGANDLWLRDGDVIEVPDLPPGARAADSERPGGVGPGLGPGVPVRRTIPPPGKQ